MRVDLHHEKIIDDSVEWRRLGEDGDPKDWANLGMERESEEDPARHPQSYERCGTEGGSATRSERRPGREVERGIE